MGNIVVSYLCVLKLRQVSSNSNEKQKSFLMTHLTDGPYVKVNSALGR